MKGACKSFLHHNNNKRPKKLKNQQLLLNSVNCGHRANHWPQTRDGYRKSQLTLSRSPHIETSSGNRARAGENLTATEGLPEAQSRQKLRTEHSRGAHTLWILPLGALPDPHGGVLREKTLLCFQQKERKRNHPEIRQHVLFFITKSALKRTTSPGPNLLRFYQNLTHLGGGRESAGPADSSLTLQSGCLPN